MLLVACEESQAVTKAFRHYGVKAFSADIKDCSGGYPEWHIKGDVLNILDDDWDMIIAHPPCTYLSAAGTRSYLHNQDCINWQRVFLGLKGKEFFMKFYNNKCKRICIENPVPFTWFQLPHYTQVVNPMNFGETYSKITCLWLKGLPPLMSTCITLNAPSLVKLVHNPVLRSKTSPMLAAAMAKQWHSFCN